jgi:hypothetical protein
LTRAWYDAHLRPYLRGGEIPEPILSFRPDPTVPLADQLPGEILEAPDEPSRAGRQTADYRPERDGPPGGTVTLEIDRGLGEDPYAGPKTFPVAGTAPTAHRPTADLTQKPNTPGIGHNDGPPIEGGESDDRLTGDAGDDALGPPSEGTPPEENPWARREDESLEDFRFRIAKELESKNPDPAKLEELEAALLEGIFREPNAVLLLQGATPEQLDGMEPVTGGLGFMGTLNEIRGQHIAATGKKHADAGDTGALIEHALDIPIPSLGHGEGNRRD